jgi:hypothetical protein
MIIELTDLISDNSDMANAGGPPLGPLIVHVVHPGTKS